MAIDRVRLPTKFAYGFGQVADAIKINAFELFLFFYYNQVLGLSGTLTGLAVFLGLCADAINDPVFGSVSDNLHSRWGRRHPLIYLSIVPAALAYYGLFSPPSHLSETGLFVWLLVFGIFLRTAVSLYHVPYQALGAELSNDYRQRSSLVAFRTTFGLLGAAGLVIISFSYFFRSSEGFTSGQLNPANYPNFAVFFAVVMGLSILVSAVGTHHTIKHLFIPASTPRKFHLGQIWRELIASLHSHAFRVLIISLCLILAMVGIQNALTLHMLTYFWELPTSHIQLTIMASILGQLAGVPFAGFLHHRLERKWILIWGILWSMGLYVLPVTLRLLGWLPDNGDQSIVVILIICWLLSGMGSVQATICAGSMIADINDDHEVKTYRSQTGIFFGGFTFVVKASFGIGHAIAGVIIDLIHFPRDTQPGQVEDQILFELGLVFGPVTGVIGCVGILSLVYYRLTRKQIEANRHLLNERHRQQIESEKR
jgi:glycoside/pentoside/hexuronide:cation symporter, GPH family